MARRSRKMYLKHQEWHGDKIERHMKRAIDRACVGIATSVATDGKRNVHVITGTLRRSIHSAPVKYMGLDDHERAMVSEIPNATTADVTGGADHSKLEVGSWLPYACVEEVGRGHRFMQPAVESHIGQRSHAIVQQAIREEYGV